MTKIRDRRKNIKRATIGEVDVEEGEEGGWCFSQIFVVPPAKKVRLPIRAQRQSDNFYCPCFAFLFSVIRPHANLLYLLIACIIIVAACRVSANIR